MMKLLDRTKQHLMYRKFTIIKAFENSDTRRKDLSISLCDRQHEVVYAFDEYFHDKDEIEILQGNILDLSCDALVSPANSFGDMSGGFDKAIDDFYEGKAQKAVRRAIDELFLGELVVGNAIILPMKTKQYPFLIVAPTMRVPGNVRHSINAYLSMRAILVAIVQYNAHAEQAIYSVAIPGLCSGVGGMSPQESAEQMWTAYEMILEEKWRAVVHPALAPYVMREG